MFEGPNAPGFVAPLSEARAPGRTTGALSHEVQKAVRLQWICLALVAGKFAVLLAAALIMKALG